MRYYGKWKSNRTGIAEDPQRCVAGIWSRGQGIAGGQCSRQRGHGPHGLYCKQHARLVATGGNVYVPDDEEAKVDG